MATPHQVTLRADRSKILNEAVQKRYRGCRCNKKVSLSQAVIEVAEDGFTKKCRREVSDSRRLANLKRLCELPITRKLNKK
jgi:hypothetical protein